MAEQGAIEERCGNCNGLVPEDSGYENGRGDLLCDECFVDQWGPSSEELVRAFEQGGKVGAAQPVGAAAAWTSEEFSGLDLS